MDDVWMSWWLPLVAGPFVGSFLGVLIRRLPAGRDVVRARSACEACGRILRAWELIPVLSFVLLRGRCARCGGHIGWFHPAVELAALAVAGWAVLVLDEPAFVWAACVLGWGLLALAWIDWETFLLPDILTLPLLAAGLGAAWVLEPWLLTDRAVAAGLGWALFEAVAWAYRRLTGREGLGGGDAKLMAVCGAWLGLENLPWVMAGGAVLGIGLAIIRGRTSPVPFGPPLALAAWLLRTL